MYMYTCTVHCRSNLRCTRGLVVRLTRMLILVHTRTVPCTLERARSSILVCMHILYVYASAWQFEHCTLHMRNEQVQYCSVQSVVWHTFGFLLLSSIVSAAGPNLCFWCEIFLPTYCAIQLMVWNFPSYFLCRSTYGVKFSSLLCQIYGVCRVKSFWLISVFEICKFCTLIA